MRITEGKKRVWESLEEGKRRWSGKWDQRCGFATKVGGRETTLRALEERGENAPPHGHHLESVGPIEVPNA